MDKIQAMQEYGNLDGLLQVLRQNVDPALRARAARAIGQMEELEAAEPLTGAALNDPDASVRQEARLALHDLLGDQADLVLRLAETSGERDEPWLEPEVDQPAEGELSSPAHHDSGDPHPGFADYETLRGLILIARGDPNRELRLRAAASLGNMSDMTAIRALADLALWDDDEGIRQAAESALASRFGEKLPEVLEGYRQEFEGGEDEFPEMESRPPYASQPKADPSWNSIPERKQESASTIGCLLLVFLLLAGLYLILR